MSVATSADVSIYRAKCMCGWTSAKLEGCDLAADALFVHSDLAHDMPCYGGALIPVCIHCGRIPELDNGKFCGHCWAPANV